MIPEIRLTLEGHLGVWETRMRVDAPGMLWVSWLRHPAHGLLGIYVLPKALSPRAALLEQAWVTIQGVLRPRRVAARVRADPRSEWDGAHTPLLIHAISIIAGAATAPRLPDMRQIQVKPGRWIGGRYLAPARHLADVVVLAQTPPAGGAILTWCHPYGVVTWVGARRYLRYVLVDDERRAESGR